jgi:hypothetical protein
MVPVMQAGDRVSVPDRYNWNAGQREEPVLIASRMQPGPPVLQGPPLAPTKLWQVDYGDGAVDELPEEAIQPLQRFEIQITEMSASFTAPAEPEEQPPGIRDETRKGEAADSFDAERRALNAWDEKYGQAPTAGYRLSVRPA